MNIGVIGNQLIPQIIIPSLVIYGGGPDSNLTYTTSMSLWLLPGTASNYTNGVSVNYWLDASGNGNYAFQTGSKAPTLGSGSGVNNLNGLLFNRASAQCMYGSSSIPSFSGSMKRTMFVVYRPTATTGTMNLFGTFPVETTSRVFIVQARVSPAGDPYFAGFANDLAYPATSLNTGSKVAAVKYDGSLLYIYRNGALGASGSKTLNTTPEKYRVGSGLGAGVIGDYTNGYINEIIVYNDSLDSASMATVNSYLKTKYNL